MTRLTTRLMPALLAAFAACTASDGLQAASPPQGLAVPSVAVSNFDGDTMTVEIRLRVNVRLCGDGQKKLCYAPELKEPGGKESKTSLADYTKGTHGTLWIPIGDASNLSQLFTLGRVLGDYWPDDKSESASEYQVRTKHASSTKNGPLGQ